MAYDLRENIRDQLDLAQTIGGGFGAAMGYRELAKKRRWKEFEQKIQKQSEQVLIRTIVQGQAEGWDNTRLHQEVLKIRGVAESELYQDWVMRGRSTKKQTDYPMEQFKYWAEQESKAEEEERLDDASFAREQKQRAMQIINPDWRAPLPAPTEQPGEKPTTTVEPPELHFKGYGPEPKPKGEMDVIEELTPSQVKADAKIEELVGPPEDRFRKAMRKQGPEMLTAAQKVERINRQLKDLKQKFNLNRAELRKLEELLMNDEPIEKIIEWLSKGK